MDIALDQMPLADANRNSRPVLVHVSRMVNAQYLPMAYPFRLNVKHPACVLVQRAVACGVHYEISSEHPTRQHHDSISRGNSSNRRTCHPLFPGGPERDLAEQLLEPVPPRLAGIWTQCRDLAGRLGRELAHFVETALGFRPDLSFQRSREVSPEVRPVLLERDNLNGVLLAGTNDEREVSLKVLIRT